MKKLLAVAIILVSCAPLTASSDEGWTRPQGGINLEIGEEIVITCGVNSEKYINPDLSFYNGSKVIDERFVRPINNSAIELRYPNAQEQDSTIMCKLNGQHGISYNEVKVGRKPEKVDISGLRCVAPDWYDMNCTFVKPYNPVVVVYTMNYRIPGSAQVYPCTPPPTKDPKIFSCQVARKSYRHGTPQLQFTLTGVNALGKSSQVIMIDNFASVIPSQPQKFEDTAIRSDGVTLHWEVSTNLLVFPKPFDYEISIISPVECAPNKEILSYKNESFTVGNNPRDFSVDVPLKFANTWYDINFRMKISSALNEEQMWSKSKNLQVKTTMRKPDNPPDVDVGSFNIGAGGDVYIYWKHLPKCYQNGADFGYLVTANIKNEMPSDVQHHLAIYSKDKINLLKDTTITIRSNNSVGLSRMASSIVIPGKERRLAGPTKIKKSLKDGSYELSWSPPDDPYDIITSYTVFWCVSKSELPNSCEGSINFARRKPNELKFIHESNQTVNFAVSANSESSTSGMIWARCTTANSNEIGKIKTIWIPRLASKEIEVEWKLECTDSGIVAGYQLEYCPSEEPKTLECKETAKKLNITGGLDNPKHTLTNLSPYTTYKIIIRMFSNSTMGPASDPLANTTLEAGELMQKQIQFSDVSVANSIFYGESLNFEENPLVKSKIARIPLMFFTYFLFFTCSSIRGSEFDCTQRWQHIRRALLGSPAILQRCSSLLPCLGKRKAKSFWWR
jgi:cytokine receptor domeless